MEKIDLLQKMIDEVDNIVVFTGAGVSTESGIKDFRSDDGIYSMVSKKYNKTAEYMLSHDFLYRYTKDFYEFYRNNMNLLNFLPNITHKYLKKLEEKGKLKAIITQNIDGLHTKAGNVNVYELHGTIYKNYCVNCKREYDAKYVFDNKFIPKCECGGLIRPNVILYGEMLPEYEFNESIKAICSAAMLIVIGTSLTVEPASSMINLFRGKYLVIINKTKTSYDDKADLVINDNLGNVFSRLI